MSHTFPTLSPLSKKAALGDCVPFILCNPTKVSTVSNVSDVSTNSNVLNVSNGSNGTHLRPPPSSSLFLSFLATFSPISLGLLKVQQTEYGMGCVAVNRMEIGSVMATLDKALALTEDVVHGTELGRRVKEKWGIWKAGEGKRTFSEGLAMLVVYVAVNRDNEKNFWYPYLQFCPREYDDPLWWKEDELEELEGTNIGLATPLRKQAIHELFELCLSIKLEAPHLFEKEVLEEDFKWAYCLYTSRSYPGHLVGTVDALASPLINNYSEKPVTGILLPLLDLFNHKHKRDVTWSFDEKNIIFHTGEVIEEGKEVFNNYGGKGNEEFLMGYGFVLENNRQDLVSIQLGFADSSIYNKKTELLKKLKLDSTHYLNYEKIPDNLLAAIRILSATDAEIDILLDSDVSNVENPISLRTELVVLTNLFNMINNRLLILSRACYQRKLKHHLDGLHYHMDNQADHVFDMERLGNPLISRNVRNAIIYRMGRRNVLLDTQNKLNAMIDHFYSSYCEPVRSLTDVACKHCSTLISAYENTLSAAGFSLNLFDYSNLPPALTCKNESHATFFEANTEPTALLNKQACASKTELARLPFISLDKVKGEKAFEPLYLLFVELGVESDSILALYLLWLRSDIKKGNKSIFACWFDVLPSLEFIATPLAWNLSEVKHFPPDLSLPLSLVEEINGQITEWSNLFYELNESVGNLLSQHLDSEFRSWELFLWSHCIVSMFSIDTFIASKPVTVLLTLPCPPCFSLSGSNISTIIENESDHDQHFSIKSCAPLLQNNVVRIFAPQYERNEDLFIRTGQYDYTNWTLENVPIHFENDESLHFLRMDRIPSSLLKVILGKAYLTATFSVDDKKILAESLVPILEQLLVKVHNGPEAEESEQRDSSKLSIRKIAMLKEISKHLEEVVASILKLIQ